MFTFKIDEYFRATEFTDLGVFNNFSIVGSGADPVPYEATAAGLNGKRRIRGRPRDPVRFIYRDRRVDSYGFTIRSLSSPNDSLISTSSLSRPTRYSSRTGDIF